MPRDNSDDDLQSWKQLQKPVDRTRHERHPLDLIYERSALNVSWTAVFAHPEITSVFSETDMKTLFGAINAVDIGAHGALEKIVEAWAKVKPPTPEDMEDGIKDGVFFKRDGRVNIWSSAAPRMLRSEGWTTALQMGQRLYPAWRPNPNYKRTYKHDEFIYDASGDVYWDTEWGLRYSKKAINVLLPPISTSGGSHGAIPASTWIANKQRRGSVVETVAWWPGKPPLVEDWAVNKNGPFAAPGALMFNTFRAPPPIDRTVPPDKAKSWLDLWQRVYPEEHELILDFLAHLVQKPDEHVNHGWALGGAQGIGKDSLLYPLNQILGAWNVRDISPDDTVNPNYNPWRESLLVRVQELRMLEHDKAEALYNALKEPITSPPVAIALKDKYEKTRYIVKLLRLVILTNEISGLYLPPDDRRWGVAQSPLEKDWHKEKMPTYFDDLYRDYTDGGIEAIAAFLATRDLSKFDPHRPPPMTTAKKMIIAGWKPSDDTISEILATLPGAEETGEPDMFFASELRSAAKDKETLKDINKYFGDSGTRLIRRMSRSDYQLVPLPEDRTRWFYKKKVEGSPGRFESRFAFAKAALLKEVNDIREIRRRLDERGMSIAEARALF